MSKSRVAAWMLVCAIVLAGITATAVAATSRYNGKIGTAALDLRVKLGASGKIVRVTQFAWDGFKCKGDKFTGGTSKSIKVTANKFSSTQLVGGIDKPLSMTVKGTFSADGKKASGTVRVQGCTGTRTWSAKKH